MVLENHEKIAGERHQFPGEHEREGIGGQQHQEHPADEQPGKEGQGGDGVRPAHIFDDIAGAVTGGNEGDGADDKEKKAGQRIEM
ncbi:MAG: hypothetical protein ACD_75C01172G0002 [uncultured bacterium]|nr:MAG: hypothetical protein ACD_75C01172G0002 [uncultured bacterium]